MRADPNAIRIQVMELLHLIRLEEVALAALETDIELEALIRGEPPRTIYLA
jgi:hypothetical protein